ncbi:lipoprotein N-acyltransferase Lnb domain-containing protein [Flavobacterium cellulosilyticum]|uniref:DUF4105 domain-containing protein n=1 Tax=Flavobacterium cellulosilyticum TaxID=2541731 RepID=A0A4R5CAH8_9FLAO|nr:DUF4105 domain-containing protein [Flavobacterium cellulosilyticum]TDD95203.1 DUF4105 domain-containing protein [Flavobacterium cellulosilyticum]
MNLSFNKTFFFLLLIFSCSSNGQNIKLSNTTQVSIITCDTGNESYSLFGHTAIRIADSENNLDLVYNYGAFDFATPNFVAKFAKGDLQYFAVVNKYNDFINQYVYEQRSVYEQELNVPLAYKQQLFDNLTSALASSESYYTYKFIDKNCTSMVVDILNKTLGESTIVKKTDTDITYRTILYPYFNNSFYEKLGTSIIFGKKVDEYGTKIFLPLELKKSLALIQFQDHPLCTESKTSLEYKKETSFSWWDNIYTYLLILGLILVISKESVNNIYFLIMGFLGLFFGFMGYYSLHQELAYNYNIFLFNPTLLLLLYFTIRNNKKWIINIGVFNLISLCVYFFFMLNKAHLLIVLPMLFTSAIVLIKTIIKNSKRIPIVI